MAKDIDAKLDLSLDELIKQGKQKQAAPKAPKAPQAAPPKVLPGAASRGLVKRARDTIKRSIAVVRRKTAAPKVLSGVRKPVVMKRTGAPTVLVNTQRRGPPATNRAARQARPRPAPIVFQPVHMARAPAPRQGPASGVTQRMRAQRPAAQRKQVQPRAVQVTRAPAQLAAPQRKVQAQAASNPPRQLNQQQRLQQQRRQQQQRANQRTQPQQQQRMVQAAPRMLQQQQQQARGGAGNARRAPTAVTPQQQLRRVQQGGVRKAGGNNAAGVKRAPLYALNSVAPQQQGKGERQAMQLKPQQVRNAAQHHVGQRGGQLQPQQRRPKQVLANANRGNVRPQVQARTQVSGRRAPVTTTGQRRGGRGNRGR